jgi:hypothetical protein
MTTVLDANAVATTNQAVDVERLRQLQEIRRKLESAGLWRWARIRSLAPAWNRHHQTRNPVHSSLFEEWIEDGNRLLDAPVQCPSRIIRFSATTWTWPAPNPSISRDQF